MLLTLERKIHNSNSTEGNLYIDGKWFCHTIEDKVRSPLGKLWDKLFKVYGKTAIPYGTYPVLVTWSNRFKRMLPGVFNVPSFEGIRIHNGTSETSSLGCIIISYKADSKNKRLINDKTAMNDLTVLIEDAQRKEKVFLKIVDKF